MYRKIKDMTWPAPCEKMAELEWWLRIGPPSKADTLSAASIISAYVHLISLSQKKRNSIVSELRQGPNIMAIYEYDEEDEILLGQGLLSDAIVSLRKGTESLDFDFLSKKGIVLMAQIRSMADELDAIEKKYRSILFEYEHEMK